MSASDFNAIWSMWSVWKFNTGNLIRKQNEKNTKHSFNIHHIHGSIIASEKKRKRERARDCHRFSPMPTWNVFLSNGTHWAIAQSQTYRLERNENQPKIEWCKKTNITKISSVSIPKMMVRLLYSSINPVHMVWKMLWLNRFKISQRFSFLTTALSEKGNNSNNNQKMKKKNITFMCMSSSWILFLFFFWSEMEMVQRVWMPLNCDAIKTAFGHIFNLWFRSSK